MRRSLGRSIAIATDAKTATRFGRLGGQALIIVVCALWLLFGFMAITNTLPVAYDYLRRLRVWLDLEPDGSSFGEAMIALIAIVCVLAAVVAGIAAWVAVYGAVSGNRRRGPD